jgi:hypothetical protein
VVDVLRLTGTDRFDAARAVSRDAFATANPTSAFIATGLNFPDALAGSVLAGIRLAPMYLSRTDCLPQGVMDDLAAYGVDSVTLLGGTASLNARVQALISC